MASTVKGESVPLVPMTDSVVGGSFEIDHYDVVKEKVINKIAKLTISEVNEDTYSLAKENRATLNAFANALDTKRKDAQKAYMKPFNEGKKQYDELIAMAKAAADQLGDGIKALDDESKDKKHSSLMDYFNKTNNVPFLSYEQIEDTKWYNKSTAIATAEYEIDSKIKAVNDTLKTIKGLIQDKDTLAVVVAYYIKSLDMESAIANAMSFVEDINKAKEIIKEW